MIIDTNRTYDALITTENGQMRLRLFSQEAPLTVNNFVFLANQGFYDGVTFHRVLEDFMAQGGDPTGMGNGGPGYQFVNETDNDLSFDRPGILAMANAGPDTNGSQFFITFAPQPYLDGGYTIFGELIDGAEVLNAINLRDPQQNPTTPGDTIVRIDIEEVNE
ncbi:MAG: peptidylprolyl isomerase [Chloroflexi bacterium]|nr:MAG: peptidylprolyl isomerase [Chloroflexota bacterium]